MSAPDNSTASSLQRSHRYLEILLVLLVLSISGMMWRHSINDPLLLHLYYVPVVLTGFYLGGYRARLISLLCIVTGFILFLPNSRGELTGGVPLYTILAFTLWSGTVFLVAMLIGTLSDGLRKLMKETESSLKKDALTDALTNIANRRAFDIELRSQLQHHQETPEKLALILVDIDFFKHFNDRYGHQTGDHILQQVARVFEQTARSSDLVARYGGEEFALVLPSSTKKSVLEIAERTRSLIEGHRFDYQGLVHRLTVSVGVAFAGAEDDEQSFCERVDAALYSSKESGRNSVHYHDGSACVRFGSGFATNRSSQEASHKVADANNAFHDLATGLPTQLVLVEELRRRVLERQRYGTTLSIALIQIDDLPVGSTTDLNMRKSYSANAARIIQSSVRDSDFVANWSEDTFVVLLPCTEIQQALVPLNRLSRRAEEFVDAQYPTLSYSVSIGTVEVEEGEQYGDVIERIKQTMAIAKSVGNGYLAYEKDGKASCIYGVSEQERVPYEVV